jgi:hypothetical protein
MNLVLFFLMFAVGFLTAGTSGLSFWGLFSWLTIEAFVGTNPQVPVSSQTIIDNFVGLGFGMWIATIVSRLLWPILPQKVLRHSLLAICDRIKALLSGDPHQEKILTQLANLTVEALAAARQIRIAGCSKHKRQKLVAMIHALQISVSRISQLVSRRNQLPEVAEPIMRPRFAHLEIEFMQMLDACAKVQALDLESNPVFGPQRQACRELSESRCLLARESITTGAPLNDKCVVVTVLGPRTGRYFAKLDELPITRIFDAKTKIIANCRRHI